ncbi:hypothetical protein PV08_04410 [Exophiala spinifera]|uniref:Peptidase S33 tripeptidyl aminopeptidase-like C-terminal domain-containing protein n=1 Tax=Exophiala spinifera TaxID=91928 RepID=A0A0D2C0M5_9EURO|nr:uncharacterized protein PV08_04410 [Exophiala spinifera]KIW17219.1 hypothetical protein PV08_04410 [Exophiala spinifera]
MLLSFTVLRVALCAHIVASLATTVPHDTSDDYFDWTLVQPSTELKYVQCYGSFECARLEVPLDWTNRSNPNRVSIAIVRLPAVVDVSDESFGGTIIINPGGPGGSGVDILLSSARSLQSVVDSHKHFEILSFDPRGMKFSTPSTACFTYDIYRTAVEALALDVGDIVSDHQAFNAKWNIDKGLGQLCSEARNGDFGDGTNMHQFVSTALVVRDMVEIIDQVDIHLSKKLRSSKATSPSNSQIPLRDEDRHVPLLNYWGLSYGTYLGNTFASMFPERIGRMVLDGVVDADDYAATGWTTNLQDNNQTWTKFFEYCFEAGPKCALFDATATHHVDIQTKVEAFLFGLIDDPMPVLLNGNLAMITYHLLKASIHLALYFPSDYWPRLAASLRVLMDGDAQGTFSLFDFAETFHNASSGDFVPSITPWQSIHPLPGRQIGPVSEPYVPGYAWQLEASVSVLCGDGDDITSLSKERFTERVKLLQSQSRIVGPLWAEITMHCVHWPASVRPAPRNRFTGPFGSNLSDYDPRASPLLFIGNTADPVTPVRNAVKMSEKHEGSVLLTQDVPGHCCGTGNSGACAQGILKNFFANGTLPAPGIVCRDVRGPWD